MVFGMFFFRKTAKKVLELWWLGLPPSVRGRVWKLAFGNDLHITQGIPRVNWCFTCFFS